MKSLTTKIGYGGSWMERGLPKEVFQIHLEKRKSGRGKSAYDLLGWR